MANTTISDSFEYYLENLKYAEASKDVISRILANPRKREDQRLSISGFPETGRFIWLMPTHNGQTAVIEAPFDDPSPYTMLNALASSDIWRWGRVKSPNYTTKVTEICTSLNLNPPPSDAYRPATFNFPADWINTKGQTRSGMQIHCILTRSQISAKKRLDPPLAGGAICSCLIKQSNNKPASGGCAFIARSSHFNGATFSDGLANTAYGDDQAGRLPEGIFNFTDRQFNDAAYSSYEDKSILVLLHAFTTILRQQVDHEMGTPSYGTGRS